MGQKGNALMIDCRSYESKLVRMDDPDVIVLITNSNVKHELTGSEYPSRYFHCQYEKLWLWQDSLRL